MYTGSNICKLGRMYMYNIRKKASPRSGKGWEREEARIDTIREEDGCAHFQGTRCYPCRGFTEGKTFWGSGKIRCVPSLDTHVRASGEHLTMTCTCVCTRTSVGNAFAAFLSTSGAIFGTSEQYSPTSQ